MGKNRKVSLFLVCLLAITAALFLKVVGGPEWTDAIIKLFGLFVVGNGAEHISGILKKK